MPLESDFTGREPTRAEIDSTAGGSTGHGGSNGLGLRHRGRRGRRRRLMRAVEQPPEQRQDDQPDEQWKSEFVHGASPQA